MKKAFSLIELSIVILIIGILVAGVTQSSRLISRMRISSAIQFTKSSPVSSIKDLALWLEPISQNAFATGSAGNYVTIEEPEDNTQIARWNDSNPQSTYKNDAIQSTLANQPRYRTNAINNLPALLFTNSSSQRLFSDLNINYNVNPNITFFVVFRRVGSAANQCLFGHDNGAWDRFLCPIHRGNAGVGGVSNGSGFSTLSGLNTIETTRVMSLHFAKWSSQRFKTCTQWWHTNNLHRIS